MVKAGSGDCFWIECGAVVGQASFRVVIDGGDDRKTIIRRLKDTKARNQPIDLWIVTHTDEDHILGVLELKELGDVREVWFNSPHPGSGAGDAVLSYRQGNDLAKSLVGPPPRPWNKTVFESGPVQTAPGGSPPQYPFRHGRIKVLGPKPELVSELFEDWASATLGERKPPHRDEARPPIDDDLVKRLAAEKDKPEDGAITNRACIIVLIEFDEGPNGPARYLFAGDTPPSIVLDALRNLQTVATSNGGFKLDGFKLSHHGSDRSSSKKLFQALDCPDYYISTNGRKHGLPNDPAIAKAIVHGRARRLFFNFADVADRWADYGHSRKRLEVIFPKPAADPLKEPDHIVVAEYRSPVEPTAVWSASVDRPAGSPAEQVDLNITRAGDLLKVVLTTFAGPLNWEIQPPEVNSIKKTSEEIRDRLDKLASTWPGRERFEEELMTVAIKGRSLFYDLFEPKPEAESLLKTAKPKTSLVARSPRDLSIPFGLIHGPGDVSVKGLWAYRFTISSPFDGSAPTDNMALHLLSYIGCLECSPPYPPEFGAFHEHLALLDKAWRSRPNCLNHFLCHNDREGGLSNKDGSAMGYTDLHSIVRERNRDGQGPDVLFLNACNTLELRTSPDWDALLSSRPFYGFIGTESLVNYRAASEFAVAFVRTLKEGVSVYEAFDRTRHQVWPASLFYTMCLQPAFARAARLAPMGEGI
jgi:hypothetical protein